MDPQPSRKLTGDLPFRCWTLLFLLALAFVPLCSARTPTTISEDIVIFLFFACSLLWWRRGWPLPTALRSMVDFLMFGFLFTAVWRNQIALVPEWGRLMYWPVACLVLAACLAGGIDQRKGGHLHLLPLALFISLVGLVFSQLILPATLPDRPFQYRAELLIPGGLIVVGLFSLAVVLQSARYATRRKLYITIPILFGLIAGGRGLCRDSLTLRTWWNAGRLERSVRVWRGEEAETAREARRLYSRVLNTLEENGGLLVRSWELDFLLRYRLAEMAGRMDQPARMLAAVPPQIWTTPQGSALLADLWNVADLDRLRRAAKNPRYLLSLRSPRKRYTWEVQLDSQWTPDGSSSQLPTWRDRLEFHVDIYVNHEIAADGSMVWFLDRWGRVFRTRGDSPLEPIWEAASQEGRSDAVDLEIWDGNIVVAFANGEVRFAADPPAWFPQSWRMPLRPGHRLVDIERHPSYEGAVALSSHGSFSVVGRIPESFPIPEKPLYPWAAAKDLEISPDGLGWYVLHTFGAVHAQTGGDPLPLAVEEPDSPFSTIKDAPIVPYWEGQEMALDIELDPLGRGICLLNRPGEAWTIADPPFRPVYRPFEDKTTMGLGVSLAVRQDGAMVLLYAPGNIVVQP